HVSAKSGAKCAARIIWRRRAVFHHPYFSNSVRSTMDHSRLGALRCGSLLAVERWGSLLVVSTGAASWVASRRSCVAGGCICAARSKPSGPQLPCPLSNTDLQLVSLHVRHRHDLPLCCRAAPCAAAKSRSRPQRSATVLRSWNDSRVSVVKHRDYRLLQPAGPGGADISIFRKLRARHDL